MLSFSFENSSKPVPVQHQKESYSVQNVRHEPGTTPR